MAGSKSRNTKYANNISPLFSGEMPEGQRGKQPVFRGDARRAEG
jgi:hypothetical protein